MKEQDAAHSFEKERCQYELWVKEYFGLPENFPERAMSMSFDYGQMVNMLAMFDEKRNNFYKQNVADVMFERDLELTRLRSELQEIALLKDCINKLLPLAERMYSIQEYHKGKENHEAKHIKLAIDQAKELLKKAKLNN